MFRVVVVVLCIAFALFVTTHSDDSKEPPPLNFTALNAEADAFCKNQTFMYLFEYKKPLECIENDTFFKGGKIFVFSKEYGVLVDNVEIESKWAVTNSDAHMIFDAQPEYEVALAEIKAMYPEKDFDIQTHTLNETECTKHTWSNLTWKTGTFVSGKYFQSTPRVSECYLCKTNVTDGVLLNKWGSYCKPSYLNSDWVSGFETCQGFVERHEWRPRQDSFLTRLFW